MIRDAIIFWGGMWAGSLVTGVVLLLFRGAKESAGPHVPPEAGYSPRSAGSPPRRNGAHLYLCGNDD
jgi:hypothetical protein